MNLLLFILIGLIAGALAGRFVSGHGYGVFGDIVVGVIGAFLGGWLAGLIGMPVDSGSFTVGGLLAAFVGAVILLVVFRALTHRGMLHT